MGPEHACAGVPGRPSGSRATLDSIPGAQVEVAPEHAFAAFTGAQVAPEHACAAIPSAQVAPEHACGAFPGAQLASGVLLSFYVFSRAQ